MNVSEKVDSFMGVSIVGVVAIAGGLNVALACVSVI